MVEVLEELVVKIGSDVIDLRREVEDTKRKLKELDDATDNAGRGARTLATRIDSLGRSMARIGGIASISLTAPLALFGRNAIRAAVDAEELQSAFNFTFGEMADVMNEWAETTGNAIGRSTQTMQQAAFQLGQLFNAAAPTAEAAAELSQRFSTLTVDLASFFNMTEDDALLRLRAGLVGEAEPLRRFGVFLTAAAVEARALEMGLGDLTGALTEQDKILARAALIWEATSAAHDDATRTAGSAANQSRALHDSYQELAVDLGRLMLPVFRDVVSVLKDLVDWFKNLDPEVQRTILVVGLAAAAFGPLLIGLGAVVRAFGIFFAIVPRIVAAFKTVALAALASSGNIAKMVAGIAAVTATFAVIGGGAVAGLELVGQAVGAITGDVENINTAIENVNTGIQNLGTGGPADTGDGPLALTVNESPEFREFRESLMTAAELEQRSYQQRLAQLEQFRVQMGMTDAQYNEMRERIEGEHNANMEAINFDAGGRELDAEREHIQRRLEAIQEGLRNETEAEKYAHEQALADLQAALDQEIITREQYNAYIEELEAQHQERLRQIRQDGLSDIEKFTQMSFKDQAAQVLGELQNLTAGVAQENRAMFAINKAAAIGMAIVNTIQGVTKSLSAYPMPLAGIMAAAHAAAGFAQVAAIRRTQFGGGGGAAPVPTTAPSTSTPTVGGGGGTAVAPQGATIYLMGGPSFSEQQVRDLIEQINMTQENGPKLKVYPRS